MRNWIQQKYPWTCSMVAVLNAAKWWNLPRVPSQESAAWKKWIARCGARYGAATQVDLLHQHLGLAAVAVVPEVHAIEDALAQDVPIEATIWLQSEGLHAVLLLPDRDAADKPCALALGMIRERRGPKKAYEYVHAKTSIERLLADHCFPIGNPNRRFQALVPRRRAPRIRTP